MEKRQFRALYRQFLFRVVDPELLAVRADPEKLLGQMGTALLSFSVFVSVPVLFMGPSAGHLPQMLLRTFEHFFIATTMLVVGLFSVLSWDAVFPDRRDVLVLASLPVRSRTIFLARMAATGAGLGVAVCALNGISGLLYPWLFTPQHSGWLGPFRSFAVYWITLTASALFVFGAVLLVQGIASQLLPRQLFLRLSAVLQIAVFCLLVSVYVLEPSLESNAALTSAANHRALQWLPSYWFLGMFQQLSGAARTTAPEFNWLAHRAWIAVGIAAVGVLATVLLSYLRTMRKVVEEPDILPSSRSTWRPKWRIPWLTHPAERTIIVFAIRIIFRSRQHRMTLSFYLGAGFGVMLILLRPSLKSPHDTSIALLTASALMLCTAAAALRTVFSMPMNLRANWIFRMAALDKPAIYARALRRAFLLLAIAPVWICFAVPMLLLWPWRVAAAHLALLALLGSLLADLCMAGFRKIPFTCSYRPGKANLQFALWGALVLLPLALLGAHYEWKHLQTFAGQFIFATALLLPAAFFRWRTIHSAAQTEAMQFEDLEDPPIVSLELGPDAASVRLA